MASNGKPPARRSHQDSMRLSDALAVLQSPELLARTALKNGQSIPATRLAYEKLAAGIKEKEDGRGFRRDVTAAEDKFNPDWMKNEEKETLEQRRSRN